MNQYEENYFKLQIIFRINVFNVYFEYLVCYVSGLFFCADLLQGCCGIAGHGLLVAQAMADHTHLQHIEAISFRLKALASSTQFQIISSNRRGTWFPSHSYS